MTSLLSLDITEAYNRVICDKMMHVLWAKGILKQLAEWVKAFIIDRILILMLLNIKIEEKSIFAEVFQEFSLFPILYLFYIAELLEACNSTTDWLSISVFIDDIMLLAYKQTMERNY